MTPPILLGKLTRREFRERMGCGELQACILPTAAIEQHLEHLAMEHDWRSVNVVAEQVDDNDCFIDFVVFNADTEDEVGLIDGVLD